MVIGLRVNRENPSTPAADSFAGIFSQMALAASAQRPLRPFSAISAF
jgi:hypothetical protein